MSGFGAMLSFEARRRGDAAERVCAATQVIVHTTSLGGIETTMERRRRHSDEDLTPDGLIRVSVGCEHVDDLWADLDAGDRGGVTILAWQRGGGSRRPERRAAARLGRRTASRDWQDSGWIAALEAAGRDGVRARTCPVTVSPRTC